MSLKWGWDLLCLQADQLKQWNFVRLQMPPYRQSRVQWNMPMRSAIITITVKVITIKERERSRKWNVITKIFLKEYQWKKLAARRHDCSWSLSSRLRFVCISMAVVVAGSKRVRYIRRYQSDCLTERLTVLNSHEAIDKRNSINICFDFLCMRIKQKPVRIVWTCTPVLQPFAIVANNKLLMKPIYARPVT